MKTVCSTLITAIIIGMLIIVSCTEQENLPMPPTITISPDAGYPGDVIIIKGKDFGDDKTSVTVTFNGKEAAVNSVSDTLILTTVPEGAGTGVVIVVIDNMEITGPEFKYMELMPVINGLSLYKGTYGDVIVIEGNNFGEDTAKVSVTFNHKNAEIKSVYNQSIEMIVPKDSGTGTIKVTVGNKEVEGPVFTYVEPDPADMFTTAKYICDGAKPMIAIDTDNGVIHLAYVEGGKIWYRQGDLDGNFSIAEEVLASQYGNNIWQPTLVLDDNNVPHISVCDSPHQFGGFYIYYVNRIGGQWSDVLQVFDSGAENLKKVYSTFIATEGNSVYLTAFIIKDSGPSNAYARIDSANTKPVITRKEFTNLFLVSFPYVKENGELWVFQGAGSYAERWVLQQLDKSTLTPIGEEIVFLRSHKGEQVRWLFDNDGEIHVAGAAAKSNNRKREGWYYTLSRRQAGLLPIKYRTTNWHANGAAQPVRDLKAPDRVYVTYWNGIQDTDRFGWVGENPWGCTVENQINFMRVENGKKVNEGREITARTGIHGTSYRTGPAAAAHPYGGMVIVFPECGEKNVYRGLYMGPMRLYFTHIGKSG